MAAALLFFVVPFVEASVATSDVAEDAKAVDDDDDDDEYAILFLPDATAEKESPMASCRLSSRMRVLDRFIVGR
jgi:hypothetical protein